MRRLTRKAVESQEDLIAKKYKTNSKIFWNFLNSKTKMRSSLPELCISAILNANEMTSDDQINVETLVKFFSSIYVKELDWSWLLGEDDKPRITENSKLEITKGIIAEK